MSFEGKDSRTQFLATAVHEIRTPVQTIIGTLELLKETNLDKEQTEYLRQLQFSADVLLTLANDVLDFSKIQSGKFEIEHRAFATTKFFEQITDLVCIEATNKKIELISQINYNIPQVVISDPTRIQQIIVNLIKNAVKFTKEGHVKFIVDFDAEKQILLFQVEDTGIGIPKEKQDKIFTEYYQVDKSTTRNYGGTGLGLAICKKLTELLNGTIKVETNSFNGTTFSIEIPYKIPEKTVLSDFNDLFVIDSSCITNKNVKILIVDDYKESINNFKSKLNFLGFSNIEIASSGYSALEQLTLAAESNKAFDMVFIDMQMPIMDGWRLASEINNNKKINSSKLFLLIPEGYTDKEAKMKILGWFNGYLYKPVKMNNLVELITEKQDEIVDLEVVPNEDFENTKKIKILAAEDHPVNRKLLTTFLKQFNSEVLEAENGKEALDIIQTNHDVDIIFMDIQMPIINGIEATKEIRKLAYDGIIIACTANTDTQDFEEFQKAGMNDILVKPFKKQDIQNMINKWSSVINISATENHRRKKYSFVENIEFSDNSVNELWDKIDFLDTVSNDISLAQKLIDEYIAQTRILLMQAKDALYHNNFEELAKIAHTLKGSSSTISAKSLYSTAYQMEKYSKEELTTEVVNSISKFIALFTRFIKEAKHQKEDWQND